MTKQTTTTTAPATPNYSKIARLYDPDQANRIMTVRRGLPAKTIDVFTKGFGLANTEVYDLLGLSTTTGKRRAQDRKNLDSGASERALFIAGLVKTIEDMIPAGAPQAKGFDAPKWIAQWLEVKQPALGGQTPGSFLDTAEGRTIVENLLGQIESGAYS